MAWVPSTARNWLSSSSLKVVWMTPAFVQPMPEHTATPRVHQHADGQDSVKVAGDQLMGSVPFVDSVLTGKTFTPYLVLTRPGLLPSSDRPEAVPIAALARIRSSSVEPPTRPG